MGWNEFLFGSKESRARSKEVLKEMRPQYDRPKVGGSGSAPKLRPPVDEKKMRRDRADREAKKSAETAFNTANSGSSVAPSRKVALPRPSDAPLGAKPRKADPMPRDPNNGLGTKAAPPKPKAKPVMPAAAPKAKAKPAMPAAAKSSFKGNWKNAAPTPMQAGMRSRNRNLRDK